MRKQLFILSTIIGISACFFADPFIKNHENARNTNRNRWNPPYRQLPMQRRQLNRRAFKATSSWPLTDPRHQRLNNDPANGRESIKNEPRPIISAKPVAGTPLHFKEIVIGRCWEYQMKIGLKDKDQINCEKVWDYFHQAFAFKGPCEVTTQDYKKFLRKIDEEVPKDKALLWSGCRELAHKYSDFGNSKRFTTLEDTLAGYLFQGLSWCGKTDQPGINFDTCPYDCSIQAPYWAMANLMFAKKLKGAVHVLLNGTRKHLNDGRIYPSYLKDRYYFGPYVIPNIDPKKVNEVQIIVAHTLHQKPLEKCGQKSVKQLENEIMAKGIKVRCYDDPDFVKHLLCIDEKSLEDCRLYRGKTSSI